MAKMVMRTRLNVTFLRTLPILLSSIDGTAFAGQETPRHKKKKTST